MNEAALDTSAYSALLQGHPAVRDAMQTLDRVVMSPIVLGELRSGFLGGNRPRENLRELEQFLSEPKVEIVPLAAGTAERFAVIVDALRRSGRPLPSNDIWIAASAMEHGLKVLTLDKHFLTIQQIVVECFERA
jgi:predicted nucleic acid-binding protein